MNAREVIARHLCKRADQGWSGISLYERGVYRTRAHNILAEVDAAGFTIMSKEDVEAVRAAMVRSIVAIDDWLHQYASDMCSEDHVKATGRRIFENGGTLAYIADVQEKNSAAIRKLKSGGDDERIRREMDEVLRKQSERDIPFAPATRPAEQAVTEKMVQAHKEGKPIESCSRDYSSKDWYLCSTLSTRGRTMGSWQPIETAPKDGTKILVYYDSESDPYYESETRLTSYAAHAEGGDFLDGTGIAVAIWVPGWHESEDEFGSGYWMPGSWFAWFNGDAEMVVAATHWQPLPAPPKEDGK